MPEAEEGAASWSPLVYRLSDDKLIEQISVYDWLLPFSHSQRAKNPRKSRPVRWRNPPSRRALLAKAGSLGYDVNHWFHKREGVYP